MISFEQPDIPDPGADLDDRGSTFDLQILDDRYVVAFGKPVADRVGHDSRVDRVLGGIVSGPFVRAFGTGKEATVLLAKSRAALWADGYVVHMQNRVDAVDRRSIARSRCLAGRVVNRTTKSPRCESVQINPTLSECSISAPDSVKVHANTAQFSRTVNQKIERNVCLLDL